MIGKVLGGRYEILGQLGGGGMAVVYRAYDNYLGRTVAVKMLRPQFCSDPELLKRFKREAQAAASLSHPNIVSIFDVGDYHGVHYIVMEYIAGETLKQYIKRRGRLPVYDALSIAAEICSALDHAHRRHVIHRDIKPHNIMITKDGRVKVADFGIARAAADATLTNSGSVMGSAHYFSPEQARGGFTSERSDLYSLGVVMYEMLTGQLPFDGENPVSIAVKHMQEKPKPPSTVNAEISPAVENIVMKALEKNQALRFASAEEMLKAIRDCMFTLNTSADPKRLPGAVPPSELPDEGLNGLPADETVLSEAQPHKKKKHLPLKAVLLVALAAFLVYFAYQWVYAWINVPTINVPDVTNKPLSEAQKILASMQLGYEVVGERYDEKVPVSYVISQSPEAGSQVKARRKISLWISRGQEYATVPDVTGRSTTEATALLHASGLDVGSVVLSFHPQVPQDYVISQNPKANTRVAKGTLVDLEVSKGVEPTKVVVPNFTGQPLEAVLKQIEGLGLDKGEVTLREGPMAAGLVMDQDPKPSQEVPVHTPVNLAVSLGRGTAHKSVVQFKVPTGRPGPVQVRATVSDSLGVREVYNRPHPVGADIKMEIEWWGNRATLSVTYDGALGFEKELL
ncbi:MAG TPA: Stk1 family PASTA domain-containing Ser/Thr kinase [Firmicutes bacterium]|nr:Stk1 family PASTA domain-containing Ser/Thr kinase [Bacillota bacterium]